MHKAIRRLTPAPKARVQRRHSEDPSGKPSDHATQGVDISDDAGRANETPTMHEPSVLSTSPKTATLMMRRSSAGVDGQFIRTTVPLRANFEDIKEHLKHLGPSNPATNPKKTQSTTVKIKPGTGAHPTPQARAASVSEPVAQESHLEAEEEEGDETTGLLRPQVTGKDGIQALRKSYGSVSPVLTVQLASPENGVPELALDEEDQGTKSIQTQPSARNSPPQPGAEAAAPGHKRGSSSGESANSQRVETTAANNNNNGNTNNGNNNNVLTFKRANVRSGSITENVIESRGVRKVVLETTSSNDDDESAVATATSPEQPKLLGRSTFSLFGRDGAGAAGSKDESKSRAEQAVVEEEEEEEEGVLSPDAGEEEAPGSSTKDRAEGSKESSAGGGGKKKNRRKKRKGGK